MPQTFLSYEMVQKQIHSIIQEAFNKGIHSIHIYLFCA